MYSEALNNLIENQLYNTNFGRILLLNKFEEILFTLDLPKKLEVAVVGGSKLEPEILLLKNLGYSTNITTFGIEDEDTVFLNLNEASEFEKEYNFDLVICGQVIEHIWNIENFVKNILLLMNDLTYSFIHCPKSNIHHGHTFYSSGYSKEFFLKIFGDTDIVSCGELGTSRLYTSLHLLKDWITTREATKGKINFRTWYSFMWNLKNSKPRKIKYISFLIYKLSFKKFIINRVLSWLDNNENEDKLVKSESYIFFKRN
jgi:hypothetical protein